MVDRSFSRIGQPVQIPFDAHSAGTPFDMTGHIPVDENGNIPNDLTFTFTNSSMFDVRLEGTQKGQPFVIVTAATGWLILARTELGPFASRKPMQCSVQAFSTNGAPIPNDADFTGCYIELTYGRGR